MSEAWMGVWVWVGVGVGVDSSEVGEYAAGSKGLLLVSAFKVHLVDQALDYGLFFLLLSQLQLHWAGLPRIGIRSERPEGGSFCEVDRKHLTEADYYSEKRPLSTA